MSCGITIKSKVMRHLSNLEYMQVHILILKKKKKKHLGNLKPNN